VTDREMAMIKVAAVLYSYYPQDVRPRRESEALIEAGMQVDMICCKMATQPVEETVRGVNTYRLPMRKKRAGKLTYIIEYLTFILRSFVKLSKLQLRERYDIVQVHNMPDILVFAALLPKLMGAKILLDLHDPMPELFMTKYGVPETHPLIRFLALLEKLSIKFADRVITPNIAFRELFIARGCPEEKISIVMNTPVEKIFSKDEQVARDAKDLEKFVIMFHGTIFERHGVDTALEAVANLRKQIPGIEFRVFGDGDYVEKFQELIRSNNLEEVVKYHGPVSWEQISREIQSIDVGIIPNKKTPFTEVNLPVRIFEYLSLGKPVIAPKTKGVLDYFDDDSIFFFEAGNTASLCDTILSVYRDKERRSNVIQNGMKIYMKHKWELQRKSFVQQVAELGS
jgi:glycosyltransferase involved in cell wall biosynthesis